MNLRQTKSARLAIIISISLHIVIFMSIAWIKLSNEYSVKGKVSVEIFKEKATNLARRSMPVRAIPSFNDSPQRYNPETIVNIGISKTSSPIVYADRLLPGSFSSLKSLPYEVPQKFDIKGKNNNSPTNRSNMTILKEANPKPANTKINITGGYKFIDNASSAFTKPEIKFTGENSQALRQFLTTVRRKIESKKRYPISARNAGIEGRSEVRMTILKDGKLEKAEIIKSSGNEILDNAALESIHNAIPFPPIPAELKRERIEMSIYLIFNMEMSR
jgi:TonB family protein